MQTAKQYIGWAALFLSISVMPFSASAKKAATPLADPADQEQEITVPLQQSQTQIAPLEVKPVANPVDYEIAFSSWLPSSLSLPAGAGNATGFTETNIPELSLNRYSEIVPWGQARVELVAGLSYAQLARSSNFAVGATANSVTENLNLTSGRLGVAYRNFGFLKGVLQPMARLAIVPTWLTASSNAIDQNGLSAFGVPVEGALELIWAPTWWPQNHPEQGGGMSLGLHATSGSVGAANLNGAGADAALRMTF